MGNININDNNDNDNGSFFFVCRCVLIIFVSTSHLYIDGIHILFFFILWMMGFVCRLYRNENIFSTTTNRKRWLVVNQLYDPEVQNPAGFIGSNVLLKCNIPNFVKDYVSVTSWLQEPSFNIYPSMESGKFSSFFSKRLNEQKILFNCYFIFKL